MKDIHTKLSVLVSCSSPDGSMELAMVKDLIEEAKRYRCLRAHLCDGGSIVLRHREVHLVPGARLHCTPLELDQALDEYMEKKR